MNRIGTPLLSLAMLALLAVSALGAPRQQVDETIGDKIDAIVQQAIKARNLPGVSVAVVHEGMVVHAKGYGYANLELGAPATEESVYLIGSVTKPFTSMAIMKLVEEGALSLDDPISKFFDDIPEGWSEVTVTHLLQHTSGIKSYTGIGEMWLNQHNEVTGEHIISMAAEHDLEFEPGKGWAYNNTGYVMLGMIIEKVSETSYEEYIRQHIFDPLGMLSSGYNSWTTLIPNRTSGYSRRRDEVVNADYLSMSWPAGAGALYSSVEDLSRWVIAMDNHEVLSDESYDTLYGTVVNLAELGEESFGPEFRYALGWIISDLGGKKVVSHGGGINGFNSEVMRVPEDKFAVIVLVNFDGGAASIATSIRNLFYPDAAPPAVEPIEDDAPETTAMIKTFLANALKGEVDRTKLTEEFSALLSDEMISRLVEILGGSEVGEMDLLQSMQTPDGMNVRRYAVRIGNERVGLTAAIDSEGKIAGLQVLPL